VGGNRVYYTEFELTLKAFQSINYSVIGMAWRGTIHINLRVGRNPNKNQRFMTPTL
jgi:hypothetical protein